MEARPTVSVLQVVAVLAGVLAAWLVSTATTVPAGGPVAGVGVGLGVWAAASRIDSNWFLTRRLHLVIGGAAVAGAAGMLAARRVGVVPVLDGAPVYPLGVFICGSVLASQGTHDLAATREREETVRDRVSVTVPRGRRLFRAVVVLGVASVGVRLLVGDPVGWLGVLAAVVPGLIFYDANGGETELVALESGVVVVTDGTGRFVPWRFVHRPVQKKAAIRLSYLLPYPGVHRRVADDAADARSFADTVRRQRRR